MGDELRDNRATQMMGEAKLITAALITVKLITAQLITSVRRRIR